MKISELKEKKIIHRPTRYFDESGKRIYNEFEYEIPYNPVHKSNETERLFAKIIDMIPFFLVFFILFHQPVFICLLLSVPGVIILGSFCEWYVGTTLGKKVFKLTILDDHGNHPGFIKSLQRNVLYLANFWPVFTDYIPPPNRTWEAETTQMNFSMHINNRLCKTYIVKESKIKEIKELLTQENIKAAW
ncbi:MAG: RDD family protein [Chryseobacterium sp.]|uniref:RDD family protein n=1 Tax=Chryseobacterium sp. TaxID=1871047 RepID=UPI0025BA1271|nr:RDD family protein [Chryseobacterium sp.]MCJ7932263.1 RDD family protein [Chryseobacterium sp.]